MRKIKMILILSILFLIPIKVLAYNTAYVEEKKITLENIPEEIKDLGANGTIYYPEKANYYEFIDDKNNYNVIYEIKNNSSKLGWATFDLDGNKVSEKTINRYLTLFGTALYYNNYLYVLYGTTDNKTVDASSPDYASTPTILLAKYDTNGGIVKTISVKGYDMSPTLTKSRLTSYDKEYGTKIAFNAGNADMAVSNGIIGVNFAREMYNGHQMSFALFFDATSLDCLNKSSDFTDYGINRYHWVSHSFAQRIIGTSDNEFLMADQGDANPRSLVVFKTNGISNPLTAKYNLYNIFHFREANDSEYGYNNTYANLGNIIELNDGYLVVGASEKTLSLNYANSSSVNEPRNIFIQKLDKNFEGKSSETLQKFKTDLRKSEEKRTSIQNKGEFRLSNSQVIDYGVKWITDYNDYNKSVVNVRATKLDNGNIAIIWLEKGLKNWTAPHDKEYYFSGDSKYYYMIIDSDGNIIENPLEIESINVSSLINLNTKGNLIYWTQEDSNGLTFYKLDISKTSSSIEFERVGDETVYITDNNIKNYKFSVKTNKDGDLEWHSSNDYVATVDNSGNVTILKSGTTTITVTNKRYNVSLDYTLDVKYKVEEIELIPDEKNIELVEGRTTTITYVGQPYIAYDRKINWQSSNDDIVAIDKIDATHVTIRAVSGGDAKLIGTANDGSGIKVEINVHAIGKMTSLKFEKTDIYLRNGQTYQLKPIIEPKTANDTINYSFSYGNTSKITISKDGLITAGGMGHVEYRVSGRYSDVTTYINIYSYDTVLDTHSINLKNIGDTANLKVTTYPNDYYPDWQTSNVGVVTVDKFGKIKATGKGIATITVTASNGYSDKCTVVVGDVLKGDLNENGKIEVIDAVEALYYALGKRELTNHKIEIGDFNNDQRITAIDAVDILRLYMK